MPTANPFDQFDTPSTASKANPFDIFDSRQEPATAAVTTDPAQALLQSGAGPRSQIQDVVTQGLHGLGRGIAAMPGFGGDISNLLGAGVNWVGNRVAPETNTAVKGLLSGVPGVLPGSAETMGFAERNIIGKRPEPQTAVGRFVGNVTPYIPGAMIPTGGPTTALGLLGKAGMGALSGVASEGAAEAGLPPAAQVAAGLLPAAGAAGISALRGGPAAGLVRRATTGFTPETWEQGAQLQQAGRDVGIQLSGPEALAPKVGPGALGQLMSDVKATAQGGPILNPVFENRPEQIRQAVTSQVAKVGPASSADSVFQSVKGTAQRAIEELDKQRTAATRKLYSAAGPVLVPDDSVASLVGKVDAAIEAAPESGKLRSALESFKNQITTKDGLQTRTSALDTVRKEFAHRLRNASGLDAGGDIREFSGVLGPLNSELKSVLTTNNPYYASADSLYQKLSQPLNELAGTPDNPSLVRRISEAKSNEQLRRLMLDSENIGPQEVDTIASMFKAQNNTEGLSAWVRHYLENSFDKASKRLQSGENPALGAKWADMIAGTPQTKGVYDAYLNQLDPTGGAQRGWDRFLSVIERTGKIPGIGSPTAQRLQMADELASGAAPSAAGILAAGGLAAVGGPGLSGAGYVGGTWINKFIRDQAVKMGSERLAKIMTDPDSVGKLRALARKDPASSQAAAAVMAILGGKARSEE